MKSHVFPRVRIVVDLHAGGREGGFALCTSFHPVPDPAQFAEISRVAALFDTPFMLIYSSQMASGLLTDEAEAEGKIAIGGEFGFGESVNRRGVLHAVTGIQNVLRHYGMLAGDIVRIDAGPRTRPLLVDARNLEDYVPCPQDGVWEPLVDLGDRGAQGSTHRARPLLLRPHRSPVGNSRASVRLHDHDVRNSPVPAGNNALRHRPPRVEHAAGCLIIEQSKKAAEAPARRPFRSCSRSPQKISFSPNCISRGAPAVKICPVLDSPMEVFGGAQIDEIRRVECFPPELQVGSLAEHEVLQQRRIQPLGRRSRP